MLFLLAHERTEGAHRHYLKPKQTFDDDISAVNAKMDDEMRVRVGDPTVLFSHISSVLFSGERQRAQKEEEKKVARCCHGNKRKEMGS